MKEQNIHVYGNQHSITVTILQIKWGVLGTCGSTVSGKSNTEEKNEISY